MKTKTTLAALLLAAVMVTPSYGSESLSRIEKEGEKRKAFGIAAIEKGVKLIDDEVTFQLETITVCPSDGLYDPAHCLNTTPWLYGKNVYAAFVDADVPGSYDTLRIQFFVEEDEIIIVSVDRVLYRDIPNNYHRLYVKNKRLDEQRAVLVDYVRNADEFVNHTCRSNFRGSRLPKWTDKNIRSRVKRFAPKMVSEVEEELKAKKVDLLSINEALQELNTTPEDYWIENVVLAWHYHANK